MLLVEGGCVSRVAAWCARALGDRGQSLILGRTHHQGVGLALACVFGRIQRRLGARGMCLRLRRVLSFRWLIARYERNTGRRRASLRLVAARQPHVYAPRDGPMEPLHGPTASDRFASA